MKIIPRQRLVVVGNGMAGMRTVEEILKRAPARYDITVFGAEPHVNYDRIMLSSVLAGEKGLDDIIINTRAWYAANGITLYTDDPVAALDRAAQTVTSAAGRVVPYDRLLLATGSKPVAPPVPGLDLPGVCAFRAIKDVETMIGAAETHRRAIVIGGGLLGLEAANGLAKRGMQVAVVHLMDRLMDRQLDHEAARLLQKALDARGIAFFTQAETEEIYGTDRVAGVRLADGRDVPGDLVVLAIGIRPNVDLARMAGLDYNRGIVVADDLRTSDPAIFAVGECVEHRGMTYGLVAPLWDMAKVCADHLSRPDQTSIFQGTVTGTRLKVTGLDIFSAGEYLGDETSHDILFRDEARNIYKHLVLRDDRLVGVVLYGDVADAGWYFQLIRAGTVLEASRDTLVFGQQMTEQASGRTVDPVAAVAALPPMAEICGCNGVCKGTILDAIAAKGLTTLGEVRAHTKASASCGTCTTAVEQLLTLALGDGFVKETGEKPLCGCTPHGHGTVRAEIVARHLTSIPAVMAALDWTKPEGCSTCRPAVNFYLMVAYPGLYRDDAQSRFVNERMHANIQKDGTYSVVPRMWAGLTNADELRAIADVVDKYQIPTVKVTGGQRIDLLGVTRAQLPDVWRDLNAAGMVSGHAYGKALRTVKTCVGSEWCRFGTQDSTGMGLKLEKMAFGSQHPHKFKMAVSGCPRNCAEATIKDFGVIAVDSGWELHIGGNGGIKLRGTDFLCKVTDEAEVLEHAGAFMQFYREDAYYLERTAPWVERVGLAKVKAAVVEDPERRAGLYARFLFAQSFLQEDPWANLVASAEADPVKSGFKTLAMAD